MKRFRDTKYLVYPDGRVFSQKRNYFMTGCVTKKGYLTYTIRMSDKVMTIKGHRLVAECYIENPNNYPDINHINNISTDNRVENLEWCTSVQNIAHKIKHNRQPLGEKVHNSKLTNVDILEIRRLLKNGVFQREIARMFNVAHGHISNIKAGRVWSHLKSEENNG